MDPVVSPNGAYYRAFMNACRTGNTRRLSELIIENRFHVNQPVKADCSEPALVTAIKEQSEPVIALLLNHGADIQNDFRPVKEAIVQDRPNIILYLMNRGARVNYPDFDLLNFAARLDSVKGVCYLLGQGADVTFNNYATLRETIRRTRPDNIGVLMMLLEYAIKVGENPNASEFDRRIAKYSHLCCCMLDQNIHEVTRLLSIGDYESYANVFDENLRPAYVAAMAGTWIIMETIVKFGVDLERIYKLGAEEGHLNLVKLCTTGPGFDPAVRYAENQTVLYLVCCRGYSPERLKMIDYLVRELGLKFDEQDMYEYTPLFNIWCPDLLRNLLKTYPDLNVNVVTTAGATLLTNNRFSCAMYTLLLEHRSDPQLGDMSRCHSIRRTHDCNVVHHLQKLMLLDPEYVENIVHPVLDLNMTQFAALQNPSKEEYDLEVTKMVSVQISRSTSTSVKRTLFDFILLKANEAARFSRNEIVLNLYAEHHENFCNYLPHYGFALNYQLRRAILRAQRLKTALDLIISGTGKGLPLDFAEWIFGYFSDRTLERFKLEPTNE